MRGKEDVFRYLEKYRGKGEGGNVILRAGNALVRYNITVMEEAIELKDSEIAKMRGVGEKTKVFIRQAIEDYQKERAEATGRGP